MKKALLSILKTGLFIFFIYNLGIFSYLSNIEKTPASPRKIDGGKADTEWLEEKYNRARELGAQYGPEDYFNDLAEIELKRKQNDFDYHIDARLQGSISNLNMLFHDNLYMIRMTKPYSEYNDYLERVSISQTKYDELINPGITAKREAQKVKIQTKGYWSKVFLNFLSWIFKQYLKNFLAAFILLWIWWYQEKKTIVIKNPLSFIFCLLLYPLVIIRTWARRLGEEAKYLAMTIEYRRHSKNLFALFSENEIIDIKQLIKEKTSLADYRLILEQSGSSMRHTFFPALLVSLLFISLPSKATYSQELNLDLNLSQTECWQNAPPGALVDVSIDNYSNQDFDSMIMENNILPFITEKKFNYLINWTEKCLKGHRKRLKPIPLFINN